MRDKHRRAKLARELAGLSAREAASRLGKSRSTIHAWEQDSGAGPRSHEDLVAMCRLYGITIDWYLEGIEPIYRHELPQQLDIDEDLQRIIRSVQDMSEEQRRALAELAEVMVK